MANESLISVPPNVDDPIVLRRFLSRLVEQLDVVIGNRASQGYATEQELAAQAEDLAKRLSDAEKALAEAEQNLQDTLENTSLDFDNEIEANKEAIDELKDVTPVKGCMVQFLWNSPNLEIQQQYNVNALETDRVSLGRFKVTVARPTIYDKYMPGEAYISAQVITPGTTPYIVKAEDQGAGVVDIFIYKVEQSGTTDTTLVLTDPGPTEIIHVMMLFNVFGSNLPPSGA